MAVAHGPAGSGKTVLVADWVSLRNDDWALLWVDLSATEPALFTFWRELLRVASDSDLVDVDQLAHGVEDLASLSEREVLSSLLRTIHQPLLVVIDAHEQARDASEEISRAILTFLAPLPDIKVVVATRSPGLLASVRTAATVDVALIGPSQLAFTAEETAALLTADGVPADAQELMLPLLAEGHAVTIRSASVAMARRLRDHPRDRSQLRQRWHDTLRKEIESIPSSPDARAVLRSSSLLPYVTVSMVCEITGLGEDHCERILTRFADDGLGMWTEVTGGRPAFRYSDIVRESVAEGVRIEEPESSRRVATLAARWMHRNDQPVEALALATATGDLELVLELAMPSFPTATEPEWAPQVRELLAHQRPDCLRERPIAAIALALMVDAERRGTAYARMLFPQALLAARLSRPRADPLDAFLLACIESSVGRVTGDTKRARRAMREAWQLYADLEPSADFPLGRLVPTLLAQLGVSSLSETDYRQATVAFAAAGKAAKSLQPPAPAGPHQLNTVVAKILDGDITGARRLMRQIDPVVLENGESSALGTLWNLGQGLLHLEEGRFREAEVAAAAVHESPSGEEYRALALMVLMFARLAQGRANKEADRIALELRHHPLGPAWASSARRVDDVRAVLLLVAGRLADVEAIHRAHPADVDELVLSRALYEMQIGRAESAFERLARFTVDARGSLRERKSALLFASAAAARCGRDGTARELLGKVASLREAAGMRYHGLFLSALDRQRLQEIALATEDPALEATLQDYTALPIVMPNPSPATPLTERERIVLAELTRGGPAQIAERLIVSPNTVKSQLRSLYRKLGVTNREDAIARAVELNLLGIQA
ncbi:hypothetical protein BHE97_17695 [Aeromicrobium sp. PE09-221]|nr:hypothetical protein BHE97_17695 [Aeromicrobium sp. PE09-221]